MAAMQALYNLKVKNTFIEVDDNDDTSSNLSFFEEEEGGIRRQVSEPAPARPPFFEQLAIKSMPTLKFLEGMQTKDNEEALEGSTTSEDDLKADQKGLMSRSTTSSSQPECEPDFNCFPDMEDSLTDEEFGYYPDSMARQVTEEMCWNKRNDNSAWQSDKEYTCLGPLLSQASPEPYPREPLMVVPRWSPAAGRTEEVECTPSKRKPRSDAHDKAMNARRRKRESLIDQAARKQKLQQQQRAKQQQRRQAASSAHSNVATQREVSRPQSQTLARFCHKCGGTCRTDYRFCRFCGAHVLFLQA